MTSKILNPAVTGGLQLILSHGPAAIREPLRRFLGRVLSEQGIERFITLLKLLSVLGIASKVNARLNDWALNNWKWSPDTKNWDWKREVAVVTGGNSGIGKEVVKQLMRKGVKVAVFDIAPTPKDLEGYANMYYIHCDVTQPSSIADAALKLRIKWGDPSILVNNAGVGKPHNIVETPNEWVTKIFTINIISHFWMVKEFMPSMIEKNKGHIVGLASMASFVAPPGIVDYAATKAGVTAFHEGLNMEIKHVYKTPGVLNTICHPSWVRTPLVGGYEDHLEKTQGKLLRPEGIAKRIVTQIYSCRGGQLIIPSAQKTAASIRGQPNWIQEVVRDFFVGGKASKFTEQAVRPN